MKASKDLERFLDFLKSAESQLDQAMAGQQEAEANKELAGYQYDCWETRRRRRNVLKRGSCFRAGDAAQT